MRQMQYVQEQLPMPGFVIQYAQKLQKINGDAVSLRQVAACAPPPGQEAPGDFRRFSKQDIAFTKKVLAVIDAHRLMALCVITRTAGKTAMTLCNLWRLTKYEHDPRIVLHEFSLRTNKWMEKNPASVAWLNRLGVHGRPHIVIDAFFTAHNRIFPEDDFVFGELELIHHSILRSKSHYGPIWPNIYLFAPYDDAIAERLMMMLLIKVLLGDDSIYCQYINASDRIDIFPLLDFLQKFACFNSGFKWGSVRRITCGRTA